MPNYEYLCEVTNEEFEQFHSIMTKIEDCPLCKEAGREPHAPKRLISGGSGRGIVQLSDAEFKAALPSEANKIRKRATTDEHFLSNLIGSKYRGE